MNSDNWGTLKESPEKVINIIEARIEGQSGSNGEAVIDDVIHHLIPLHIGLQKNVVENARMQRLREELRDFFTSPKGKRGLIDYVDLCDRYAMRGSTDGYERACGMRSALQLLNDDFTPWDEIDRTLREDIEDIDETLEQVSENAPPIKEEDIPDWVPDSHWWWRAPKRQNMSQAEIDARLQYNWNDGL